MTKDIMNIILAKLSVISDLAQFEPYEGQFEDVSEFLITPPAAFVAIDRGVNKTESNTTCPDFYVSVYLCTNHIHNTGADNMLDLLDAVIAALHYQAIRDSEYTGRSFYKDFEWLGIFPGFSAYKLNFVIKG